MTQEEKDKTSGFEAARARLTSIAYRMLGSRAEAEDVVQDAWLKWHTAAAGDLRTPLAWLTTVTTRLAIDRIRRLQSEQAARASEWVMQPWLDDMAPSAEDEVLRAASVSEAVALLFDRLSPDERAAFVLHEAFDYDYAQIAEVVGKTAAHCRQLAHRARLRLSGGQERVPNGKPRDRVAPDELSMGNIERLRAAIHGADAVSAMRLFVDSAVIIAAAAGNASRPLQTVDSAVECAGAANEGAALEAHALPHDWGGAFALVRACEVVGLVRFRSGSEGSGDARGAFTLVTSGVEVDALNRRFGARAIAQLLARIAGASATAQCVA
ncbi:sigma-70 family RNA polymerase sigma factor [Trinickia dinghuensis]|uniref:RNA polymerase subunit sigma-24 n=1 Tax=Trinickia dinghuensis TaxID=2291023 RepID=A0A3D8K2E5_9BURK|nr:sigma-70 family RNA polymerase sigma factor [Trinickia dinghuensis]RDU99637.1 RNA polymerase subunit sigma-24 [Trinickia dinghuensis]